MFFVVCRRRGPRWDASLPLERQERWTEHADFMDGLVEDGFVVLGGRGLDDPARRPVSSPLVSDWLADPDRVAADARRRHR